MSGYRTYVPWNKNSTASSSSSGPPSASSTFGAAGKKYESAYAATTSKSAAAAAAARTDAKKTSDKSPVPLETKYGTKTTSAAAVYGDAATASTRLYDRGVKSPTSEKTQHPPVSYRPIGTRSSGTARSRDPSPDKSTTSTSSSAMEHGYNFNRLYPRPYSGARSTSISRERTDSMSSTASSTTIPKYTGRSSLKTDDYTPKSSYLSAPAPRTPSRNSSREDLTLAKYKPHPDAASATKQDLLTARFKSKEDLSVASKTNSSSSASLSSKYQSSSGTAQKFITSRFLPKNSIEKSHTAYARTSTGRTSEVSRKNRELLNTLSTTSSSASSARSRTSSMSDVIKTPAAPPPPEIETVSVISRSTSPTPAPAPAASGFLLRTRRSLEFAPKQITRPKQRPGGMVADKCVQTESSRIPAARINSSPWSSFLDLKYTELPATTPEASTKPISRNASSKSISQSSSKSDLRRSRSSSSQSIDSKPAAVKPSPSKTVKLPPSEQQQPQQHALNTPNKDFRKSVLNMSPADTQKLRKSARRSTSASSADSSSGDNSTQVAPRSRRSQSSSSERSASSERQVVSPDATLAILTSADELSLDTKPKQRKDKDQEAKSFLMRALAPVTNFFKTNKAQHSASASLSSSDATSRNIPDLSSTSTSSTERRLLRQIKSGDRSWWFEDADGPSGQLRHVESGESAWWLDEHSEVPPGVEALPAVSCGEDGTIAQGKLVYKLTESSDSSTNNRSLKLIQQHDSKERSWWLEDEPKTTASLSSRAGVRRIQHVQSGERAWWLDDSVEVPDGVVVYPATSTDEQGVRKDGRIIYKLRRSDSTELEWWLNNGSTGDASLVQTEEPEFLQKYKIRHIDSGERAWWMCSNENLCGDEEVPPLGDRASPDGLETPGEDSESSAAGRLSPYDNVPVVFHVDQKKRAMFISKHTNIDDILGGSSQLMLSPLIDRIFSYQQPSSASSSSALDAVDGSVPMKSDGFCPTLLKPNLDDAALQLYKDGDYGSYLDLDASISEQQEEFEGFHTNKKNSIVLRTQLSVRVHTIIEKLLTSEGRELRRALFSLKQIFQEDKDLVHEFVQNDGLACLIKVGSEADQNYQNYILRALGQVMLYVDGMNGVMEHNETVQWLYTLISSKFRLVVKTALKLLLVFVEYTDNNCMLLIRAVHAVDGGAPGLSLLPWHNVMKLLKDFDSADTELLIYATTLINKCLNGVPDQDTYYDQTDALEEQGIENIIQRYMSKPGTDLDLLQQFQIYEAVLQYEDGEDKNTPIKHLDETIRKTLRSRKSLVDSAERRKSRRHSTGNTPHHQHNININNNIVVVTNGKSNDDDDDTSSSSSSQSSNGLNHSALNGCYKDPHKVNNDAGVTPALRRRLERAERQRSFLKEQQEHATLIRGVITKADEINSNGSGNYTNGLQQRLTNGNSVLNRNARNMSAAVNKLDADSDAVNGKQWIIDNKEANNDENDRNNTLLLLKLKKENTVKDLTQKLANQNVIQLHSSPPAEENNSKRGTMEGMTGLISKAKEGLAKSKSQASVVLKSSPSTPTEASPPPPGVKCNETKKSENELRWEELVANMSRPLNLCDLDFTDLADDDETDVLAPVSVSNGVPPPPPPLNLLNGGGGGGSVAPPPPPRACMIPTPPVYTTAAARSNGRPTSMAETKIPVKKNKKTVKLFWREVRDDPIGSIRLKTGYIWDELHPVVVDTQKLEHLFESRAKDLISKKQQEINKNKEIIVLDPKRSNAINIGMTKLPPPRSIKTAILKMDATIMNREGIEKLLTMLPTEEERSKIQEAQTTNPDIPLGSAEQFLLTLASISELPARLRLWAFKLDFENVEREIAEPLMDLKQGLEVLRVNKTFRGILSTLLSIGNFLNGAEVKGFQIEYLAKVPEVKDTVHKHSLLHHLCHIVMEKFPDASDLYSEIGAITRASKIDFDELAANVAKLEADCKASWDHLKLIAKHDGATMKAKTSEFLADCAERIILLAIIQRRVINRFHRFLLWLGIPLGQCGDTKPSEFCRVVSEFALEYRTTRERVLQQLEKKANHRERNKTRGKMITETPKFRSKEDRADAELRQLLGSDYSDVESLQGTLPWRRTKHPNCGSNNNNKDAAAHRSLMGTLNGHLTDGDDEILESLVKTATKTPSTRTAPRERKRTRHADRKSLRRTLKNGLTEEEKKHLSAYIKGYTLAG